MKNHKRVGLVGPIFPYRGGIAQYTTMMHRALSKRCHPCTITFKKQYPSWLYPGKADIEPGYGDHSEPGVQYRVTYHNPVTWLKTGQQFVEKAVDFVIIPWWTIFWAPSTWFLATYLKRKGIDVLFLCHNVVEHETARWRLIVTRMVLKRGLAYIVHSNSDKAKLITQVTGNRILVHPHPTYNHFKKSSTERHKSADLELLFFGFVRHYKGVDVLADAMDLLGGKKVHLSIVGEWWLNDPDLRQRLKQMPNVELVDRYVTEEEASAYLSRADVVVIPYRRASGSGVLTCAFSYSKPVIATRVGGLPEAIEEGVTGRIIPPEDPQALADAVKAFLSGSCSASSKAIQQIARERSWDNLIKSILLFSDNIKQVRKG